MSWAKVLIKLPVTRPMLMAMRILVVMDIFLFMAKTCGFVICNKLTGMLIVGSEALASLESGEAEASHFLGKLTALHQTTADALLK